MSVSREDIPRVAIVTGAARGLGAAIAARLAEDGHDVAVVDLDRAACVETVDAVIARGRRALPLSADVADENAVRRCLANVATGLGAPTVLVNNAGIIRPRTLAKTSLDDWTSVIDVNLRGTFLMCREALPHMRAAGFGRIVNLASIAALGAMGESNYSAAKAGVIGMTRTLAIELGRHGVTANVVAPGYIVTDMNREVARSMRMSLDEMTEAMLPSIDVGRPGDPDDIANAVSFFADPRSGFVTGQTLYVAGSPRG